MIAILALLPLIVIGITHVLTLNWSRQSDQIAKNLTLTADGEVNVDVSLTSSQANKEHTVSIDVSTMTGLYISFDNDVTIYGNDLSSGAPDFTISVTGGRPVIWYSGIGGVNPLTDDVTALYITNGAAAVTTGYIRVLHDATP